MFAKSDNIFILLLYPTFNASIFISFASELEIYIYVFGFYVFIICDSLTPTFHIYKSDGTVYNAEHSHSHNI